MILAGTGHRPSRIGYGDDIQNLLTDFLVEVIEDLHNPTKILSGMALMFDTALANAALRLQVPFDAIVPFAGQELRWPAPQQAQYKDLLNKASNVVIVSPGRYMVEKLFIRNEYLVTHSDALLSLWNGDPSSGTAHCVRFAQKKQKPIINIWKQWVQYRK